MRAGKTILLVVFWMLSSFVFGGINPVKMLVPKGFNGAVSTTYQGGEVEAYVKKIEGSERGTLLQITAYDFGSKLEGLPTNKRSEAASYYLSQFLSGIEKKRTSFHAYPIIETTLDNLPATRVEWKGVSSGFNMNGVMYCVVVGTKVILFHMQGFDDSPLEDRTAALTAIETVEFDK